MNLISAQSRVNVNMAIKQVFSAISGDKLYLCVRDGRGVAGARIILNF